MKIKIEFAKQFDIIFYYIWWTTAATECALHEINLCYNPWINNVTVSIIQCYLMTIERDKEFFFFYFISFLNDLRFPFIALNINWSSSPNNIVGWRKSNPGWFHSNTPIFIQQLLYINYRLNYICLICNWSVEI